MKSVAELEKKREQVGGQMFIRNDHHKGVKIIVGTSGMAADGRELISSIMGEVQRLGLEIQVTLSDEVEGFEVHQPGKEVAAHKGLTPEQAADVVKKLA